MSGEVRRILVLRFGSLGDVVLATATFRLLRRLYPAAEIHAGVKQAFASALVNHPCVDEVLPLDSRKEHRGLAGFYHYGRMIRERRYDLVVDLHGNLRSRVFSALSGAKVLRADKHWLARRRLVWFKTRPEPPLPHVAQRYLLALEPLRRAAGAAPESPRPDLHVSQADAAWAGQFLKRRGVPAGARLVAVSPGAAWPTKRWPARHFAAALDILADRLGAKVRFLFVGAGPDLFACEEVVSRMRQGAPRAVLSAGETNVGQLMALIARSEALLTNDSGPMHVGVGLGVPCAALFGPTDTAFGFAPLGPKDRVLERPLACRPCTLHGAERCPLVHHDCLEQVPPIEAAEAILAMMEGGASPRGRKR